MTLDKPEIIKYEHKVASIPLTKTATERQTALNTHGQEGWELTGTVVEGVNLFVYMKRAILA